MEELLHVVATDQSSGATAEVFVYSYDTMLSLRRALSTAMKLPQLSLKFDGANTAMHLTLEAAGLQNHSQVQVAPVTEVVLASASSDGTVLMWDAISGKCLESLRGHQGDKVLCVAFAVSGKLMGTSGADGSAKIWETVTGACLCTLKGSDWVTCLAFDPTERTVATAGLDCAARISDQALVPLQSPKLDVQVHSVASEPTFFGNHAPPDDLDGQIIDLAEITQWQTKAGERDGVFD
ncbi:unnamed protein product [Effrenium voratum]|nr:unnamed protein product [Effrenium voratum]